MWLAAILVATSACTAQFNRDGAIPTPGSTTAAPPALGGGTSAPPYHESGADLFGGSPATYSTASFRLSKVAVTATARVHTASTSFVVVGGVDAAP